MTVHAALRKTRAVIAAAGVAAAIPSFAVSYSALPTTATVVDAQTGEPIAGANVVASWRIISPTGRSAGLIALDEAVTDARGVFHVPGWGPKEVWADLPRGSRMAGESPEFVVFKSGYRIVAFHNDSTPDRLSDPGYTGEPVRRSDWDGKALRIEKFTGTIQSYAISIGGLVGPLESAGRMPCPWLKLPDAYRTLRIEKARLDAEGVRNGLPGEEHLRIWTRAPGCPVTEVRKFFEEYDR